MCIVFCPALTAYVSKGQLYAVTDNTDQVYNNKTNWQFTFMLSQRSQLRCVLSRRQLLVSPYYAFELINTRVSTNTHIHPYFAISVCMTLL